MILLAAPIFLIDTVHPRRLYLAGELKSAPDDPAACHL
jgi:hypothetical protein